MSEQQQLDQREFNTLRIALGSFRNSAPDKGLIPGDPLLSIGEVDSLIHKLEGFVKKDGEEDPAEKARKAQEAYDRQARFGMQRDANAQMNRKFERNPDDVQPENPGPGANAMITERAKEQGMSRKGQEPPSARQQ